MWGWTEPQRRIESEKKNGTSINNKPWCHKLLSSANAFYNQMPEHSQSWMNPGVLPGPVVSWCHATTKAKQVWPKWGFPKSYGYPMDPHGTPIYSYHPFIDGIWNKQSSSSGTPMTMDMLPRLTMRRDVSNPGAATSWKVPWTMSGTAPRDVCRPCCICSSGFFRPSGSAGTALGILIAQVSFVLKREKVNKSNLANVRNQLAILVKSNITNLSHNFNQLSDSVKGAPEPLAPPVLHLFDGNAMFADEQPSEFIRNLGGSQLVIKDVWLSQLGYSSWKITMFNSVVRIPGKSPCCRGKKKIYSVVSWKIPYL